MDSYYQKIEQLNRYIKQIENERDILLNKQKRYFEAKIKKLESQMSRENEKQRRQLEAEYLKKLREYKSFIHGEYNQLEQQFQDEIKNKDRQICQLKNEIRDIEKVVQKEVRNLKVRIQMDIKKKKEMAIQYVLQFQKVLKNFHVIPHQKFAPKKLDNLQSLQREMDALETGEMYEAESAVAISGISSLHRLEIEVNEQVKSWMREYDLYKQYTQLFYTVITHHLAIFQPDLTSCVKEDEINETFYKNLLSSHQKDIVTEIDYWAEGKYRQYIDELVENMELIKTIEAQGVNEYLLRDESVALSLLVQKNQTMDFMIQGIDDVYFKANDHQRKYHMRKDMMKHLMKHFEIERNAFQEGIRLLKPQDESSLDYVMYKTLDGHLQGDLRRAMHGLLRCQGDIYIHIYIRPEDLGDHYRNIVILYDDFGENYGHLVSIECDDYQLLKRIMQMTGLLIDNQGYERNGEWYVPYINQEAISLMQNSRDQEIVKFAGKLNHMLKNR